MIYDLNGIKGPNTVGKDIGIMAVFYPSDSLVVTAVPLNKEANDGVAVVSKEVGGHCTNMDRDSRLPSFEELSAMYINATAVGKGARYWSSKTTYVQNTGTVRWHISLNRGVVGWDSFSSSNKYKVLCIKR